MARPIRDEPTRTASTGDPVRAQTRFTEGYDWVEQGSNALAQAGADIATILADRARRQDALADAVAATRAKAAVVEAIDARLRGLDPRSPDYRAQVEAIAAEETQRVLSSAGFVRNETRQKLEAEFVGLRGQVVMGAMDRREKALIDDARQQATIAINTAAAAAAAGASPGAVMLDLEAKLAPILAAIDPQVRDSILLTARSTVAGEAVKALVDRREFGAAEAMLRSYGSQGLLTPGDVRAIRSGIEREKRQAAAEANMLRRMQEADLREQVAMAANPEEAQRIIDAAVRDGRLRRGSPLDLFLRRQVSIAQRNQVDKVFEVFQEGLAALDAGRDMTPENEQRFLAAAERLAADNAARELGIANPNASVEEVAQARRQAAATAREFFMRRMMESRPHDLPATVEAKLYRQFSSPDPEVRARAAAWIAQNARLGAEGLLNPRAQRIMNEMDPHTAAIVNDLIVERQPVTAEAIAARRPATATPEERKLREEEWNKQTRGQSPAVNPMDKLTEAFKKLPGRLGENIPPVAMNRALQLMQSSYISGAGLTMEQAAARAAELVAAEFPPNFLAPKARVPAPFNPAVAVPPAVLAEFGETVVSMALNNEIEKHIAQAIERYNARRAAGEVELRRQDVEVVPVAVYRDGRPVGITLQMTNTRSPSRPLLPSTDANGNRWFLEMPNDPAEFVKRFDLPGVLQRELTLEQFAQTRRFRWEAAMEEVQRMTLPEAERELNQLVDELRNRRDSLSEAQVKARYERVRALETIIIPALRRRASQ